MRKLASLCFALATLAGTSAWAGPCDVVIREGVLDGLCDFGALYSKSQQLVQRFDFRPRHTLRLPNLVPDGFDYYVRDNILELSFQVENQNWPDSLPFDAHITVIVTQSSQATSTHNFTVRFPGVPAGGTLSRFVAYVPLFDRDYDNNVITFVSVDTPTMTRARGEVIESSEADNFRQRVCRVHGRVVSDNSGIACN